MLLVKRSRLGQLLFFRQQSRYRCSLSTDDAEQPRRASKTLLK
jgi:hypothetical protein